MDAKSAPRAEDYRRQSDPRDATSPPADRPVAKDRAERDTPDQEGEQARSAPPRVSVRDRLRQHPYWAAAGAFMLVMLVAAGVLWWLHARQYESTDDAFIDARSVSIASQLTGTIVEVPVTDNEAVPAG